MELAGIDPDRLGVYLRTVVGDLDGALPQMTVFGGGRSGNVTVAVAIGDRRLVLRRPPLGPYDPAAYDPARDHRFLVALAETAVPTPRPVALCLDETVIGVPFYLMEQVDGRLVNLQADAPEVRQPGVAAALGEAMVDGLADLHAVDPAAVGLGDVGRPDGFVVRQVRRWTTQLSERGTRELPGLAELSRRLVATVDAGSVALAPDRPTIVHGDFNLSNLLFSPDLAEGDPSIAAVLDWEQATVGHPLVDLGVMMSQNGPWQSALLGAEGGTAEVPGFPDPRAMAARYGRRTGLPTDQVDFFHLLALFKILVITEDVRARYDAGHAVGDQYARLGEQTEAIAAYALDIADRSGIAGLDGRRSRATAHDERGRS